MYALVYIRPSAEGGPHVEEVCGVFETNDKRLILEARCKHIMYHNYDVMGPCCSFKFVKVRGPFIVMVGYENRSEYQNVLADSFVTKEEAEQFVAAKQMHSYNDWCIDEFELNTFAWSW